MTGTAGSIPGREGAGWLVCSMPLPGVGEAPLLADALRRLGARSVEREGGRVVALFPPTGDDRDLNADVEIAVRVTAGAGPSGIEWSALDRRAWLERVGPLPPRRIGPVVIASAAPPDRDAVGVETLGEAVAPVIHLEPSTAFGSGEHPTTRGCVRALGEAVRPGDRVADVGTGTGVLALAAALLGAGSVSAWESDPVSAAAARRNVALNDLADRVEVITGAMGSETRVGDENVAGGTHDGIVANLPGPTLRSLVSHLVGALVPGGWLITAGAVGSEPEAVRRAAQSAGVRLVGDGAEDGWWIGHFERLAGGPDSATLAR